MSFPILGIIESIVTAAAAASRNTPKAAGSIAAEVIAGIKKDPVALNALNLETPIQSGVTWGGFAGFLFGVAIVWQQLASGQPDPQALALGFGPVLAGLFTLYRRWSNAPPLFSKITKWLEGA